MIKKIAIVGIGSIGSRHLRLVHELLPRCEVVIVRSGNGTRSEKKNITEESFDSLQDAIDAGIQAAVISTPSAFHIDQMIMVMKAGIHVLVEKPLSNSIKNINTLLDIHQESKAIGLIGYCLRYDPAAVQFKEMLNEKKIGKILHVNIDCGSYLPDWRPGQDYRQSASAIKKLGGGVLLELSHELDYIRWFFGEVENVMAKLGNSSTLDIDVEDSAEILLHSMQGFNIGVHLDFNSRTDRRTCKARCTEGDLIWDAISKTVTWVPSGGSEEVKKFQYGCDYIYREQLRHFFDCIENGQQPKVTVEDGIATLRIVEGIRKSSTMGKRMDVE